jgi:flagellar FliL protein
MAEAEETEVPAVPARRSGKALLIGLGLALMLGGGGFYAAYSGLLPLGGGQGHDAAHPAALGDVSFVALAPLLINLGPSGSNRHLRFTAQLEVAPGAARDVESLAPRILDVLNGYLRAVDQAELQEPAALIRLRAQMLRRVQIVVGEGRVRDLLVTEFVLN